MTKIAISIDFMYAYSLVERRQQRKVREFIEKFKCNPQNPGQNYEKLHTKDGNLYSAKIGEEYRAIVVRSPKDDIYILVWVDHHDKAYKWAERHCFHVNPTTGALQIVETSHEVEAQTGPVKGAPKPQNLFNKFKDKELLRIGIPENLLPLVRGVQDEAGLDRIEPLLPQEAYEALFFLASGESMTEVVAEIEHRQTEKVIDTQNFEVALHNADSKRRFYVVEDALELQEILNAPLEQWRVFLHPSQRELVEKPDFNGPVRVLGGPGTGKTVVAMHRARFLAEKVFSDRADRILFVTFTRNLAADIQHNLRKICSTEAMGRIEVANIDHWVSGFLRQHEIHVKPVFGGSDEHLELWDNAYNLDPTKGELSRDFYRDEWDEVIQAQGITTLEAYMKAPRTGRGRSINRQKRRDIWTVFEEYRSQLNENGKKEFVDMVRDARQLIEAKKLTLPYRAVVVDEAQDMGSEALKLIRGIVPRFRPGTETRTQNDLFLVGDAHQRIYRHKAAFSQCGIDIRGRSRKLRINYRTTDEIRKWAMRLLEGLTVDDLDGEPDSLKGYKSLMHGPVPEIHAFKDSSEEAAFVVNALKDIQGTEVLKKTCIVARTNRIIEDYVRFLDKAGLVAHQIHRNAAEDAAKPGIRLATMHRVKGLEFDNVIVVSCNDGIVPLNQDKMSFDNETSAEEYGTLERALLYVAVTRAKKRVLITSYGKASAFL